MTSRHRSVTGRHELSVITTRFRSMADVIGSSAAALKWACGASRSESNAVLLVVRPCAFEACISTSRFVLRTSKNQSLRRPASPFARITTEGDVLPGCAIPYQFCQASVDANRTLTADNGAPGKPSPAIFAFTVQDLCSGTHHRDATMKKLFVAVKGLPITYGAVRRIGRRHPLRRDPARVPHHNTYIRSRWSTFYLAPNRTFLFRADNLFLRESESGSSQKLPVIASDLELDPRQRYDSAG
jgi:hypothetical protein